MIKRLFIPNRKNGYQPIFLQRRVIFSLLLFVFLAEIAFLIQVFLLLPRTNIFSSILPGVLVDLTNSDRQKNNVPALSVNELLTQAAQLKANDMAQKGYFNHQTPEGLDPWHFLDLVGYDFRYAGENLAVNFSDSEQIQQAWMESPSHKENILNDKFTEIGVASAKGLYQDKEAFFVVQFFGYPVGAATVAKAQEETSLPSVPSPQAVEESKPEKAAETKEPDLIGQETTESKQGAVSGSFLGQTEKTAQASFLEKVVASPQYSLKVIYLALAFVVTVALLLKIFVKIKTQYPILVFNGVLVLFVIISILYFNYLLLDQGVILS